MRKKSKKLLIYGIIAAIITVSTITIVYLAILLMPTSPGGESTTIKVGQYDNEPKVYEDASGNVIGIFPDLLHYMAARRGWTIEWVEGTWSECLDRLESNEIDMMIDVAYSEIRADKYDFNNVEVLSNWGVVYIQPGSDISTISELDGKKIATLKGSIHTDGEQGIKALANKWGISCTFIELDSYTRVFETLSNKSADAGVVNRLFGLFNRADYDVEETSIMFNPSKLMFAFTKNAEMNPEITAALDEELLLLKEDPNSYYFDVINRYIYSYVYTLPDWVVPTIIFISIMLMAFISVSYVLKKYNDRLRDLDRLKSMFIASMSHELRTPLTSIIGFTGILVEGWAGDINKEQEKQLRLINNSANQLLDLINSIIDISKIEAGILDIELDNFNISELLVDLIESNSIIAEKKNIELHLKIPDSIQINSDERRIKQILNNLVSNAIKFTNKGRVEITLMRTDETIEISVIDSGIGMKKEDLNKLFKPFSRIVTPGEEREGTGLGLNISQKLASLLGGEITVQSEFGEGSEFILSLKRQEGGENT